MKFKIFKIDTKVSMKENYKRFIKEYALNPDFKPKMIITRIFEAPFFSNDAILEVNKDGCFMWIFWLLNDNATEQDYKDYLNYYTGMYGLFDKQFFEFDTDNDFES